LAARFVRSAILNVNVQCKSPVLGWDIAGYASVAMDFWEFLARSEWPIVIGGTIWLLRRSFQDMLSRVTPTKVDAFGFKAEFERTLDKVEQLTAPTDQKPAQIEDLLLASPEAVILDSWRQLEAEVRAKGPTGPCSIREYFYRWQLVRGY
jgi:hypothetical protein